MCVCMCVGVIIIITVSFTNYIFDKRFFFIYLREYMQRGSLKLLRYFFLFLISSRFFFQCIFDGSRSCIIQEKEKQAKQVKKSQKKKKMKRGGFQKAFSDEQLQLQMGNVLGQLSFIHFFDVRASFRKRSFGIINTVTSIIMIDRQDFTSVDNYNNSFILKYLQPFLLCKLGFPWPNTKNKIYLTVFK